MPKFYTDALERIAATAAEAGLSVAIVEVANLHAAWVPILTVALATVKTMLAKYVGNPDTAALK